MTYEAPCPRCGAVFLVPPDLIGRRLKCKPCGAIFRPEIPDVEAPAVAPGEQPQSPQKPDKAPVEKPEDVWLEATVNSRLVDLAKALGWRTVARPYGLTFRGPPGDGVETAAVRAAGGEGVRLVLAVARGGESAALTRRELEFLMRRNDRLATCHWCLTRFGDVVVTAYVPLSGLTADSLGAAVRNLADERALLIALAPAECEDEPGAQPRPGDAEEAQAEKK